MSANLISKVSKKTVWAIGVFFFLAINVNNLIYYNDARFPINMNLGIKVMLTVCFVVAAIIVGIILWVLIHKLDERRSLPWILAAAFLLRLLWILAVRTPPVQDYQEIYQASLAFASGQKDFSVTSHYLYLYPYMIGFVLYQGMIIKVVGAKIMFLKFLNVVFSTLTVWLTARIAKRIFSPRAGLAAALMMTIYVPNIVINSILTNDILSTLLFLWALDIFIDEKFNYKRGIAVGILLFCGSFLRPLASILILAILLYGLFIKLWQQPLKPVYLIALFLIPVSYSLVSVGTDQTLLRSNISSQSFRTVNQYWKFAEGLNAKTNGYWSSDDYAYVSSGKTAAERDRRSKKLLNQRLSHPQTVTRLFVSKFAAMWSDLDSNLSWATKETKGFGSSKLLLIVLCILQKSVYMCFCGMILWLLLSGKLPEAGYLMVIIALGYILIHEGIEIQTRYRYFIMPAFMILAAGGFDNDSMSEIMQKFTGSFFCLNKR